MMNDRGLKEIATLLNGALALECPFCEGSGLSPSTPFTDSDHVETDPCPVCKGTTFNILPATSEAMITCRFCNASGRSWDSSGYFVGDRCRVCGGRGFLDISALRSGQREIPVEDVWGLFHPAIVEVARSRFETGHFADAVEAAFKHFNTAVKTLAGMSEIEKLDGARLMLRVFSPHEPLVRLADLSTESGRNVQQGYMQMFAGGMIGIRNPKAHENLVIDAPRAVHLLFLASLFFYKLDEARAMREGSA